HPVSAFSGLFLADQLDQLLGTGANLDLNANGPAVFYAVAKSLLTLFGDRSGRHSPHLAMLDRDGGGSVHARPQLAAGVGKIDLGTKRPRLELRGIQRPGGPRDPAGELSAF